MRISDWSSDVCSSDLAVAVATASAPDAASVQDDRLLFAMEPGRLLTAALFNFSLAAMAVVCLATQLFAGLLPFHFHLFDPIDWIDIAQDQGLDPCSRTSVGWGRRYPLCELPGVPVP